MWRHYNAYFTKDSWGHLDSYRKDWSGLSVTVAGPAHGSYFVPFDEYWNKKGVIGVNGIAADYVDFGQVLPFDRNSLFTMCFKLYATDHIERLVFGRADASTGNGWGLWIGADGKPYFQFKANAGNYIKTVCELDITVGGVFVLIVTYDGTGINTGLNIYLRKDYDIDNPSQTQSGVLTSDTLQLVSAKVFSDIVPSGSCSTYFQDIAIWENYVLSMNEIEIIFNSKGSGPNGTRLDDLRQLIAPDRLSHWWWCGDNLCQTNTYAKPVDDVYPILRDHIGTSSEGFLHGKIIGTVTQTPSYNDIVLWP